MESFEEKFDYRPYDFKYDINAVLAIKSVDDVAAINARLLHESPESEYDSYSWYLSEKEAFELQGKALYVDMRVSWHIGLPFYRVYTDDGDGTIHSVAEFYLDLKKA